MRIFLLAATLLASTTAVCVAQNPVMVEPDIMSLYLYNGQDEATFRASLDSLVKLEVARLVAVTDLPPDSEKKLTLAAKGDLTRLNRELDALRQKTEGLSIRDNVELQKAWKWIMPVQNKIANGILSKGSLYSRMVNATLGEEESRRYEKYQERRTKRLVETSVRMTVTDLERSMPLLADQRDRLIELMLDVEPPEQVHHQMGSFYGYQALAKIDKMKLQEFLDKNQLQVIEKYTEIFRGQWVAFE